MCGKDPVFSIIATAVRVGIWEEYYNSIVNDTSFPFEIVFVGDKRPDFQLPSNFRYIYSEVKPVQCLEIAARAAKGTYLFDATDDLTFSPRFFDHLVKNALRINDKNVILIPSLARHGIVKKGSFRIKKHDKYTPKVGMLSFTKRETWYDLGGLDRNFISVWHNHDLKLRLVERGGTIVHVPKAITEEIDTNSPILLRNVSGTEDKAFLLSCWYDSNDVFSYSRLKEFEPFVDNNLLTVSQGNAGKWGENL